MYYNPKTVFHYTYISFSQNLINIVKNTSMFWNILFVLYDGYRSNCTILHFQTDCQYKLRNQDFVKNTKILNEYDNCSHAICLRKNNFFFN